MNPIQLDNLLNAIEEHTGTRPDIFSGIEGDETFTLAPEHLLAVTKLLLEDFNCSHLSAITAHQRQDQPGCIEMLYHFWQGIGFSFLITLPEASPELPSITGILPGADFYEREAAEMFGVRFSGRAETPPLLLPDEWAGGPPFLRKEEQDD